MIDDKRLKEMASITPVVDDEAPEITPGQAKKARLAHVSHPAWFSDKTGNKNTIPHEERV